MSDLIGVGMFLGWINGLRMLAFGVVGVLGIYSAYFALVIVLESLAYVIHLAARLRANW